MARSRLFSSASRIASLRDKYSLPSRINCPSSGEFVRSGRGTWSAEYALRGLCDTGMSKRTDAFVCPEAVAVTATRNHDTPRAIKLGRRATCFIASPPHMAANLGWPCRRPSSHHAVEWYECHKLH